MDAETRLDIDRIFAAQQAHRPEAGSSSPQHRADLLRMVRGRVLEHADEVAQALHEDLAKPIDVPNVGEVELLLRTIDDALENLGESAGFHGAHLRYEARGVVLIFGPWTVPFLLLLEPLVPAIAAGNTVILKPNEMTPATSRVVAKIFRGAFDEAQVAVVEGGIEVSNYLLEQPVDHIFFTGSPAAGKTIMTAAAKHLASVTLELGGKLQVLRRRTARSSGCR